MNSWSNGPIHLAKGPKLGKLRDTEVNGAPSEQADGDDLSGVNDDDGVVFGEIKFLGGYAHVTVNVSDAPGYLNAWIDFNQDGFFDEQIINQQPLQAIKI